MLKEPGSFRRHLPLAGIWERPPVADEPADFVDEGRRVIFLLCGRQAGPFVVDDCLLRRRGRPALLRFGDRRDELSTPSRLFDYLRRLPVLVEFPVPPWALVG